MHSVLLHILGRDGLAAGPCRPTVRGYDRSLCPATSRDAGGSLRASKAQVNVFHLASLIAIPDTATEAPPKATRETNCRRGAQPVLEACRRSRTRLPPVHVLTTSEVYGTAAAVPSRRGSSAGSVSRLFERPRSVLKRWPRATTVVRAPGGHGRPFNTFGSAANARAVSPHYRPPNSRGPHGAELGALNSPTRDFQLRDRYRRRSGSPQSLRRAVRPRRCNIVTGDEWSIG